MTHFELNDRVSWIASRNGQLVMLAAKVTEVVPAWSVCTANGVPGGRPRSIKVHDGGGVRRHRSYVIELGDGSKHWPKVHLLQRITQIAVSQ